MHAPPAYESTNSVKKRILFVIFSSDDLFLCPVPLFKMVLFVPHMKMSNISANRASAKASLHTHICKLFSALTRAKEGY